jgi:PAS domain S-box-containing protein
VVTSLIHARSRAYLFAVACVGTAALIRFAADPWLGRSVPYLMYYPAVMLASWYGGFWPGVLATALSAGAAAFWYLVPGGAFWSIETGGAVAVGLFTVNGVVVARLGEYMRRAVVDQQKLASIVASSDDAIVSKSLDGTITSWNGGAERLWGYTAQEAIGKPVAMIIPPELRDEERVVIEAVRAGMRVEPFETKRLRKDGTIVDVSVSISPIVGPAGAIIGASKIARDIGDRVRVERLREELIERERIAHDEALAARDRLAFLADVGVLLSSSLDYQETLDRAVHLALPRLGDYCNVLVQEENGGLRHPACGHVVRDKEPILRELTRRVLAAPTRLGFPMFPDAVMKSGKTLIVDHATLEGTVSARAPVPPDLLRLGLELQPYALVGSPLTVRGRVVGVMAFGTTMQESRRDYRPVDIELIEEFARRVSLAIENARLFRHADELNRLKDEFLATLSHEMRTPLAAVLGWSRMLAGGQLDPSRSTQAIEAIERNAQAQSKIVEDMLDVARGLSGNPRLELEPVDLVVVAQRGIEAVAPAAAGKNIHVDLNARGPVSVTADATRLQQVVWNLLSNAVKFTPTGGRVAIDIGTADGLAELRVTDTGVGIAAEFLPFVFDKFRQADASSSRQHGGLGLGLAIARHLIELHGGSIEARSEGEGAGATFTVRLPRPS